MCLIIFSGHQCRRLAALCLSPSQHPRLRQWKPLRIQMHGRIHTSAPGKPHDVRMQCSIGRLQRQVRATGSVSLSAAR